MYNTLGFTDKVTRDEEWAKVKATGMRGVVRYTTHDQNHPQIVYVLAYPVSPVTQSEVPVKIGTEVPLSDPAVLAMLSEGGNNNDSNSEPSISIGENSSDAAGFGCQPAEVEPAPKA